jgi:hypothetical protein
VLGVQAAGSAPLVLGRPVEHPETVATAIRIGKPARGEQALEAAQESRGRIIAATDEKYPGYAKTAGYAGGHLGGTGLRCRAGRAGAGDRSTEDWIQKASASSPSAPVTA